MANNTNFVLAGHRYRGICVTLDDWQIYVVVGVPARARMKVLLSPLRELSRASLKFMLAFCIRIGAEDRRERLSWLFERL